MNLELQRIWLDRRQPRSWSRTRSTRRSSWPTGRSSWAVGRGASSNASIWTCPRPRTAELAAQPRVPRRRGPPQRGALLPAPGCRVPEVNEVLRSRRRWAVRSPPSPGIAVGARSSGTLASVVFADRRSVPAPLHVMQQVVEDRSYLAENSLVTLREAMVGLPLGQCWPRSCWRSSSCRAGPPSGCCSAWPLPATAFRWWRSRRSSSSCFLGTSPKYTLAALAVFFTTLVATMRRSAVERSHLARGGACQRWEQLAGPAR